MIRYIYQYTPYAGDNIFGLISIAGEETLVTYNLHGSLNKSFNNNVQSLLESKNTTKLRLEFIYD